MSTKFYSGQKDYIALLNAMDDQLQASTVGLAAVATSGSYTDLLNKPVLFSGSWTDLTNKPTTDGITEGVSNLYYTNARASAAAPVQSVFGRTGAVLLQSLDVTTALGFTPLAPSDKGVANGVASLDATGKVPASQLPSNLATTDTVSSVQITVLDEGSTLTTGLKSLNWVGSSVRASVGTNNDVTITVDTVNVISVSAAMSASIVSGYNLVVNCSGAAGLQGQSVASFVVTPSWSAQQTLTASSNAASVSLPVTGTVGTTLTVQVYAVDTAGNKSTTITKTATIVTNSAPTGTPVISAPTQIPKTTSATISFSGVTDSDGTPFTYSISQVGQTYPFTFSKISGIADGELVTITAPDTTGATSDPLTTFSVYAVDAAGAQGTSASCSITILASTVIGIVLKTSGGNGGTWGHVDVDGNDITTPTTAWFNAYAPYNWQQVTVAGRTMTKIPKFYYKIGTIAGGVNDGKFCRWVSDLPRVGFTAYPAFIQTNAEVGQFYIDASPPTDSLGVQIATGRSNAAALNTGGVTGFQLLDFWQWEAIVYLALIEAKSMSNTSPFQAGNTGTTIYRGGFAFVNVNYPAFWVDGCYMDDAGNGHIYDTTGTKTYTSLGALNTASTTGGFNSTGSLAGSSSGNWAITFITTGTAASGFIGNTCAGAAGAASATDSGAILYKIPSAGLTMFMAVPWDSNTTYQGTYGNAFSHEISSYSTNNRNARYSKY